MNKIHVAYSYTTNKHSGFGNTDFETDGIFSTDDVSRIEEIMESRLKDLFRKDKDIRVVVLSWQKYDPFP